MSDAAPAGDLRAELRELVLAARAVRDEVDALAAAAGPADRAWAALQAQSVHRAWDLLVERLRTAEPADLVSRFKAFTSMGVPMGDAPEPLVGAADAVRERCEVLATRLMPVWRAIVDDAGYVTPEADAQLRALMPQVARDLVL